MMSKRDVLLPVARRLAPPEAGHALGFLLSNDRDRALRQLLDIAESDPAIGEVMAQRGLTRNDLEAMYHRLVSAGAGQWAGGHYVAASAIAHAPSIDFLATQLDGMDLRLIACLLIEYFERDETGPVLTELRGPAGLDDPLNRLWQLRSRARGASDD